MRFESAKCTLLLIGLVVSASGCGDQRVSAINAVRAFVLAVTEDNREALLDSLTEESRTMLEHSQPGTGVRTFSFLLRNGIVEEGAQYELVLMKLHDNRAQVNLKAGRKLTKGFNDPTLPAELRKSGVPVIVIKNAGNWKVDLLATMDVIMEYAPEDPRFTPKWWPGLPYVPDLPAPRPPHPEPDEH